MNLAALKKITDFSILTETIRKFWLLFFNDDPEFLEPIENYDTTILDRMSYDKHRAYAIFDAQKFAITYVGENSEDLSGYTNQEFLDQQFKLILKILKNNHLTFFYKVLGWAKALRKKYPNDVQDGYLAYSIFGLEFKHKSGASVRLFVRLYPLTMTKMGNYKNALLEFVDITSMVKTDEFWMHGTVGKTQRHSMTFFSEGDDKGNLDLITKRELEILTLISENLSTREIAEKLFISPDTVDKHRKNMIARVGVRDTFALVEICRRCGII